MNFNLFKPKQKTPPELVRNLKDAVHRLDTSDKRKANEDISKTLLAMKTILYGDGDNDPIPEQVAQLSQEVHNNDLLQLLVFNMQKFEFEARKDVSQIFNNLLRRQSGSRWPTVEYLCTREEVLFTLLRGYEHPDIALNCGLILRECLRHEALAKIYLYSPDFYLFFEYVEMSTFDIASDAFASFKELLTRHKQLVAQFLETNYDKFFDHYTKLLMSSNYVTKRQSLKLLGEILLDRSNFNVMTKYISSAENLKLMMNLLRDKSRNIQFEAFHVFKVFVANPNKNKPILDILTKNQERLIVFLSNFHNDRHDDEQFNDEKAFLLKQIQDLKPAHD
ncbi:Mo25-like protein [Umbelopsis sp. AD052]|nr:Mo25-like protein [Umbelopsis sp. AD052]